MRNSREIEILKEENKTQDYAIFELQKQVTQLKEIIRVLVDDVDLLKFIELGVEEPEEDEMEAAVKRFNWQLGEFE